MNAPDPIHFWIDRLADRGEIFPHQIDLIQDNLLLAELSASDIEAASFLDQRVLTPTTKTGWVPWQLVADIISRMPESKAPGFIFHVGHCGSTLVSRLLGFAENTQSLREPVPLRILAQDFANVSEGRSFLGSQALLDRLQVLMKMWGRGSRNTVIKATSICTDLLPQIVHLRPAARFVFMYNRPETHIATLLAGQNAVADLKGMARFRIQRVQQITGLDLHLSQLSIGQLAALSWLSETTSMARSLENGVQHIDLLEFELLLQNPRKVLSRLMLHFGIDASDATVEKAVQSPVLQNYSKAPEHQYNAQTRTAILADARSRFKRDIEQALDWIDKLASRSDIVAESLSRFS